MIRFLVVALLAPACLWACSLPPSALTGTQNRESGVKVASTQEWLIGYTDRRQFQAASDKFKLATKLHLAALNIVVVGAPRDSQVTAPDVLRMPGIRFIEKNGQVKITPVESPLFEAFSALKSSDERRTEQWALDRLEIERAWRYTPGRSDIKVAVVDTGIDYYHPDLRGRVLKGRDFVNGDDDAFDDNFHGTHCAGILAAGRNNGGIVGVAPNITLLAVKVLSDRGAGTFAQVAAGIEYAVSQGASIISLSLGSYERSAAIDDAIAFAQRRGVLVLAGTGNQGTDKPFFPAANPSVLAVGATTREDKRARYSNVGRHVALVAPGSDILSTIPKGAYARVSGTSMATPHVAGVAALLKSLDANLTPNALRDILTRTSTDLGLPGPDDEYGRGRLQPAKALGEVARPKNL
jgi:thermitase